MIVAFGPGGARTSADLAADVGRLAARLPPAAPGSHVALICEDRYHFAVGLLAAWRVGHAVALPPNGRPDTVRLIAARSDVVTLLHDVPGADGLDVRALLTTMAPSDAVDVVPVVPGLPGVAGLLLRSDRHAATLFTSGSTGQFTAVAKSFVQLLDEVATLQATFGARPGQPIVATVPPHHLYGLLFSILWPLVVGAPFSRDAPLHVEPILDRLGAGRPQVDPRPILVSVPAHIHGLERVPSGALDGVRIISSTAPLARDIVKLLVERHDVSITEVFGSTETGGIATRDPARDSAWTPLPGVTLAVDDASCVVVTSAWSSPDPAGLRTGDRVELLPDGRFEHRGRADDVVKVGGRRVSLGYITERLRALASVDDAVVIARPTSGARNVELLAALVAPGWTAPRLREALLPWLDAATIPRRFVLVDALPREANGKLVRERVLALFGPAATEHIVVTADPTDRMAFDVVVPQGGWYFDGHFPGFPILPGVALVHDAVLPAIATTFPALGALRAVTRLKFRRPIGPGDRLRLQLALRGGLIEFTALRDGAACASGRLAFEVSP